MPGSKYCKIVLHVGVNAQLSLHKDSPWFAQEMKKSLERSGILQRPKKLP